MGYVKRRVRNGQVTWRARYREPDGTERSRSFLKRSDAERWLDSIRGDLAHGNYVDPAGGQRPFGEYAQQWQASRVHRPTTAAQLETHLRRHVLPFFAHRALGAVRRSEIQGWVKGRSEVLQPATVALVYGYLASIFRAAVGDRLIAASPCQGIALPKRERRRVIPLETTEVLALADQVPDRYRALVLTAAGTGLRQGEAFGLTVSHVDFLGRRLDVAQQLVTLPGRPPFLGPPKTDASRRQVPLPDLVLEALAAHLAAFPTPESQLIFTNDRGGPIRRSHFSESAWRPAVQALDLPAGTGFHALRHYYASLLIRHGESVKVVQARLGHANAAETLDTYSHLWPDSEDTTRAAIDDAILRARATPVRTPATS